jgi:putative ATP-dependent endonuclease of the OLD family
MPKEMVMQDRLKKTGIKGANFKCFGVTAEGFEQITPFNIVVGRNNSGKSGLLDLIELVCDQAMPTRLARLRRGDGEPRIEVTVELSESDVEHMFPSGYVPSEIRVHERHSFLSDLVGALFTMNACTNQAVSDSVRKRDSTPTSIDTLSVSNRRDSLQRRINQWRSPFQGIHFRRLSAERDIQPEQVSSQSLELSSDGKGATRILQAYLTRTDLKRDLIEKTLLDSLNEICEPDISFRRISCLQDPQTQFWEVYLTEEKKGDIRLSQSGSGLKTILLTLMMLEVEPDQSKKGRDLTIFALEELENSLHPAVLRRLLTYLRAYGAKYHSVFFLTTHSNVTVDVFAEQEEAQIVHVQHDGSDAHVLPVINYFGRRGVLDDLDIRASDLLQSNGIIWVEGPSDRKYLNKWIELWSDGELYEGNHYRILFYGGKLLSHFSSNEPKEVQSAISLLAINRNLAIMIDSDRTKKKNRLNATKLRIKQEVEKLGGYCWVTMGREIENYLTHDLLALSLEAAVPALDQYEHLFKEYALRTTSIAQKHLAKGKVETSEKIVSHMTLNNAKDALDLNDRMRELCERIRVWNKIVRPF